MKLTRGQLRSIIKESIQHKPLGEAEERSQRYLIVDEYLHGVPEFELRGCTTDYVNVLREKFKRYILLNKSENNADQREAIAAMNDVLEELEEKIYDLLEDSCFNFVRRV